MMATCRIGALDKSLWLSFPDSAVVVRIMLPGCGKLPPAIVKLRDGAHPFAELEGGLLAGLPTQFSRVDRPKTHVELTAANRLWTVSVLHSRSSRIDSEQASILKDIEDWTARYLAPRAEAA